MFLEEDRLKVVVENLALASIVVEEEELGPAHYAAAVGYQGVRAGQVQGMGRDSRDRSSSRLKAVSGTFSGYNEGGARKMKVAPVDIFV